MSSFKYQTPKFTALLKVKELWEAAVYYIEHGNLKYPTQKLAALLKRGTLGSHHVKTRCNLSLLVDVLNEAVLAISGQAWEHQLPCSGFCF